jgi:L-fuconolactonase
MIVDTHVHVYTDDRKKFPQVRDTARGGAIPEFNGQGQWAPCSIEELTKMMDEAGVDKATLVQAYYIYEYDNRYTIAAANTNRKRFTPSVILDPLDPKSPDELSRLVEKEGVTAMRFMRARLPQSSLGDPRTFPLWERLQKLKVPVAINDKIADVAKIRPALERFPEAIVAFEHCFAMEVGLPPFKPLDDLFALAQFPSVYIKVAINNILAAEKAGGTADKLFEHMVKVFGAKRIMWSSNFPAHPSIGGYKDRLERSKKAFAFLGAEDRDWIFAKTALSVYPALKD